MELLKVQPFQETLGKGMCGPASLKIILDYYGAVKTEKELADLVGITGLGCDDKSIVTAAESLGFKAIVRNESSFDDIDTWLKKDVPVIVDWFTRGRSDYSDSAISEGHYSVVVGLDEKYIYLQDPEIGKLRTMTRPDFMKVWFDFSGETIRPEELILRQIIAIHPKT
jgi:predicted double-glycine peptidase